MTPTERITKQECAESMARFIDWMYEQGPDPNAVTREELVFQYHAYLDERAVAQGTAIVSLATERAKRHRPTLTPIS